MKTLLQSGTVEFSCFSIFAQEMDSKQSKIVYKVFWILALHLVDLKSYRIVGYPDTLRVLVRCYDRAVTLYVLWLHNKFYKRIS